jgi:AraC-like DNA-binding protein
MARVPAKRWKTRADVLSLLGAAKDEIDRRACERLTLGQIARSIGLSPFHSQKLFKRLYRVSPHEYVTQVRLETARRLIEEGRTVTEACFEVGFQSLASFSRLFRRHFGSLPSELRRRPAIPPDAGSR